MRVFRVGGSVRDELLGLPDADRDFVVVGATPEEMVARGFLPVGKDFPVFLHPQTREEYALARTERKSGRGYRGFKFHAVPDVTLEADLRRRDLTINAMARTEDGTLIDPFGGAQDLRAGVLRHVSEAFAEDPLRVLRVARFAARFGFAVAPETEALMQRIVASGELAELAPERVWQELAKGLLTVHPSPVAAIAASRPGQSAWSESAKPRSTALRRRVPRSTATRTAWRVRSITRRARVMRSPCASLSYLAPVFAIPRILRARRPHKRWPTGCACRPSALNWRCWWRSSVRMFALRSISPPRRYWLCCAQPTPGAARSGWKI